jgi:O-succinylhomoserine sulfhydrylase
MAEKKPDTAYREQTQMVRGGLMRSAFDETAEAIYLTSGYIYGSAEEAEAAFKDEIQRFVYSRYANPTVAMFEERLRLLEGAEACRGTGSGMGAVWTALLSLTRAGGRVVASRALFGSCLFIVADLLPRFGVETVIIDGRDLDAWEKALTPGTDAVFLETPSNPMLEIIDLKAVCDMAHAVGASVVVDNVFATPLLQKPLEFGADVVVYSTTKHIDGQGRALGGAILGTKDYVKEKLTPFMRHTGPAMSPFNAWIMLKGLETLELRVERHCTNSLETARFLEAQPGIMAVHYPWLESHPQHALARRQMTGGSSILSFDLEGGKARAFRFLNALQMVDISNNLGDAKSLITHPTTTTHQRLKPEERAALGIGEGLVRLSVGLEDVEDLKEDLMRALVVSQG